MSTAPGSAPTEAKPLILATDDRPEVLRLIERSLGERYETVERLVRAIEMHDPETGRHVNRMASVAAMLGEKLGLDAERVLLLRAAAPMHDVGKIATPDSVLQKSGIPLEGRIVALADVFDALLSDRPYRPAFALTDAVQLIADERGKHFDPQVVDVLLDNLDEAVALRG